MREASVMGWQGVAEGVWGEILSLFRLLTSPQPKSTRTALFSKKPNLNAVTRRPGVGHHEVSQYAGLVVADLLNGHLEELTMCSG